MGETIPAGHEAARYIQQACRSGKTASVAVRVAGEWRLCRSRLLGCNLNRGILWAEHPRPLWKSEPIPLTDSQQLGFRFPSEDRRVTFMGTVQKIRAAGGDASRQAAIEVAVPQEVVCENLRQSFRVRIDPQFSYEMVLWPSSMRSLSDMNETQSMYRARVTDLSVGGASITHLDGEPAWKVGEHLGVELQIPGEDPLALMAQIRRITRPKDFPASYGLAFIGAETPRKTFAAQEILSRLVSQQQRVQLERRIQAPA